jgi:hypothetical protein
MYLALIDVMLMQDQSLILKRPFVPEKERIFSNPEVEVL